jgi:NhaP-type Na+/H+ and K+/H+ antiporter
LLQQHDEQLAHGNLYPTVVFNQCLVLQFRAILIGAVLGAVFSIIIHKLSLTTGIIPSLNIAAGLLGFIFIKGWVGGLKLLNFTPHEFTPQVRA